MFFVTTVFTLGYPDVPELRNNFQNLTLAGKYYDECQDGSGSRGGLDFRNTRIY